MIEAIHILDITKTLRCFSLPTWDETMASLGNMNEINRCLGLSNG